MSQKKINNYVIFLKELLGKGSYGSVYKGQQDNTKLIVAVKVLEKNVIDRDQYLKSALFSQIRILQLLKSENIIKVLEVMESSHNYYIIQELCDTDLEHYLRSHKQINQNEAIQLLKQICNGFLALVKEGIVHRDLKPANIMINKGVLKIGDFGFAKKNVTTRIKNQTSVGTPLYMSLQVLKSQPYTSKCDIWAVGLMFYQILHGRTPWIAHSQFQLVKNIESKPLVINPNFKEQTKDFLRKALGLSEEKRLSWDQVFLHPIFKGYFNQYAEQNQKFQNKLKAVMAQLRFQINSKNIDLYRLLQGLGLKGIKQLNYHQFQKFVKYIHPDILKQQIKFFFSKMDFNNDGSISLQQLQKQMSKHYINFSKIKPQNQELIIKGIFGMKVKKAQTLQNFQQKSMSSQVQIKIKRCFIKLYQILTSKKITLYQTFKAYDFQKNGKLDVQQFKRIMLKLDTSFTDQEIYSAFDFIDIDNSKSITFDQLRTYYCKVNGISTQMQTQHSHSHSSHHHHSGSHHSKNRVNKSPK